MEKTIFKDPSTDVTIIQWTGNQAKNQHLYFTSHSVTDDDKWLVFLSERDGFPNLYVIDRKNGDIEQLTHNVEGLLKSYVYPLGGKQGLSKASPCLDTKRNIVYYNQSDRIRSIDIDTRDMNHICDLPRGWISAFMHTSPSGKYLCVPVSEPQFFEFQVKNQVDQMLRIGEEEKKHTLHSKILLIDTQSGKVVQEVEVPFWVTHVQFNPFDDQRIIFNREGVRRNVFQRIWALVASDGCIRPLFQQEEDIWCNHENWTPSGKHIVYHGGKRDDPDNLFITGRTWEGEIVFKHYFNDIKFVHATATQDDANLIVDQRDGWISIVNIEQKKIVHLCELHTNFSDSVVFTSSEAGNCNVYEAILPLSMRFRMKLNSLINL